VNDDYALLFNRWPMARAARDACFKVHVATSVNAGVPSDQIIDALG
jgi:hypothetical protein